MRFAIGVIGVGGEAEADHAFIGFLGRGVELRQAGETAGDEREHAGGERVERAEMADGALLRMRRMRLTTSCEVQPAGLSTMMTPFMGGFGNLVIE